MRLEAAPRSGAADTRAADPAEAPTEEAQGT